MWMYDPDDKEFWLGRMTGHQIYVEETSWYSEGGEENTSGGFPRWSLRYKELMLEGPHKAEKLLIKVEARRAFDKKGYHWPAGRVAHLTPA